MHTDTKEANKAHEASQKVVDDFLAAKKSNKITTELKLKKKISRCTTNKTYAASLKGLPNIKKFEILIKKHKNVTWLDINELTGMDKSEVFRAARITQDAGVITRKTEKGAGGKTVFSIVE
jgi:hypothetical protein